MGFMFRWPPSSSTFCKDMAEDDSIRTQSPTALVIMRAFRIKGLGLTGFWCRVLGVWGSSSKTRASNVARVLLVALALVWIAVKELSVSYYNKEALLANKYP